LIKLFQATCRLAGSMQTIEIFYQGNGLREIEHIEVEPDHTVAVVKDILIKKHGWVPDTLI
jgi:hypothetical protein